MNPNINPNMNWNGNPNNIRISYEKASLLVVKNSFWVYKAFFNKKYPFSENNSCKKVRKSVKKGIGTIYGLKIPKEFHNCGYFMYAFTLYTQGHDFI